MEHFEIPNGLGGIGKICILECLFYFDSLKACRNLVGLCQEHFYCLRDYRMPYALTNVSGNPTNFTSSKDILILSNQMTWLKRYAYLLTEKTFLEGCWEFQGKFSALKHGGRIGLIYVYPNYELGTMLSYGYYESNGGTFQTHYTMGNSEWNAGDLLTLKVNMESRELHFYVNGVLQPVYYINIPSVIRFYVQANEEGDVFEFVSLRCIQSTIKKNNNLNSYLDNFHRFNQENSLSTSPSSLFTSSPSLSMSSSSSSSSLSSPTPSLLSPPFSSFTFPTMYYSTTTSNNTRIIPLYNLKDDENDDFENYNNCYLNDDVNDYCLDGEGGMEIENNNNYIHKECQMMFSTSCTRGNNLNLGKNENHLKVTQGRRRCSKEKQTMWMKRVKWDQARAEEYERMKFREWLALDRQKQLLKYWIVGE